MSEQADGWSIYILVYSLLDPNAMSYLQFWLHIVYTSTRNPTIIFVGTHLDDKAIDRQSLNQRFYTMEMHFRLLFPHTKSSFYFFAVSTISDEGINTLRNNLQFLICQSKHMGRILPSSYLILDELLQEQKAKLTVPMINRQELLYFATFSNLSITKDIEVCFKVLHEMGRILYWTHNMNLRDIIILEPHWLHLY